MHGTLPVSSPAHPQQDSRSAGDRNARAVALLTLARSAPEQKARRLRQRVVLEYLDVAEAVARRFRNPFQDWGDLRQVAYVGLTKAVQRFEPARGHDIVSFAVPTISGEIKRHLRDTTWMVRPPRQLQELNARLRQDVPDLAQRLGREPSTAEIARATGLSEQQIDEGLGCANGRRPASLDAPRQDARGRSAASLGETIPSDDGEFAQVELEAALATACKALTTRERRIVHLRFFEERTQAEIAAEVGVTQMQISRILTRVLGRLRERLTPELLAA